MPSPAEQNLLTAFGETFGNATPEIAPVAGGFVSALISPEFGQAGFSARDAKMRILERLRTLNAHTPPQDRVVLFELDFFSSPESVYSEHAQLRARATSWEHGHPVLTTTSQDAWVLVHKVDAEALLIDPLSQRSCRVIQDRDASFRIGARRFAELDLGGSTFPVREVELNGDRWVVHFA